VQPEDGPSLPERKLSALRVWHPNSFNADQTETADSTDDDLKLFLIRSISGFRCIRERQFWMLAE